MTKRTSETDFPRLTQAKAGAYIRLEATFGVAALHLMRRLWEGDDGRMKRATVFLFAAVLAMVLVYPATTPSASPRALQDIPTPQIITPQAGGDVPAFTGDEDGGDADDLAGIKERKDKPAGVSDGSVFVIRARLAANFWRMYFMGITLFR